VDTKTTKTLIDQYRGRQRAGSAFGVPKPDIRSQVVGASIAPPDQSRDRQERLFSPANGKTACSRARL